MLLQQPIPLIRRTSWNLQQWRDIVPGRLLFRLHNWFLRCYETVHICPTSWTLIACTFQASEASNHVNTSSRGCVARMQQHTDVTLPPAGLTVLALWPRSLSFVHTIMKNRFRESNHAQQESIELITSCNATALMEQVGVAQMAEQFAFASVTQRLWDNHLGQHDEKSSRKKWNVEKKRVSFVNDFFGNFHRPMLQEEWQEWINAAFIFAAIVHILLESWSRASTNNEKKGMKRKQKPVWHWSPDVRLKDELPWMNQFLI